MGAVFLARCLPSYYVVYVRLLAWLGVVLSMLRGWREKECNNEVLKLSIFVASFAWTVFPHILLPLKMTSSSTVRSTDSEADGLINKG